MDDKIEHVQGTMKRFGNNLQVGLQQSNATMDEAREKVLQLSDNMKFDLLGSLKLLDKFIEERPLKEYFEEVRENQTELIQVDDLLKGIIQLETGFNTMIDAGALANRYIAEAFETTAEKAGGAEEAVSRFSQQIKDGLSLEDALMQFREETGIVIPIKDIVLDKEKIEKELQQAINQMDVASQGLSSAVTKALAEGVGKADFGSAIVADFEKSMKSALRGQVVDQWMEDNMEGIFEGIDWTKPIYEQADAWDAVIKRIKE